MCFFFCRQMHTFFFCCRYISRVYRMSYVFFLISNKTQHVWTKWQTVFVFPRNNISRESSSSAPYFRSKFRVILRSSMSLVSTWSFANCAIVRCSTKRRFLTPLWELLQLDVLNVVRVSIEFSRKKGGGDNGEKTLVAPVLHRLSFRPKSVLCRRRVFIVAPPSRGCATTINDYNRIAKRTERTNAEQSMYTSSSCGFSGAIPEVARNRKTQN